MCILLGAKRSNGVIQSGTKWCLEIVWFYGKKEQSSLYTLIKINSKVFKGLNIKK